MFYKEYEQPAVTPYASADGKTEMWEEDFLPQKINIWLYDQVQENRLWKNV